MSEGGLGRWIPDLWVLISLWGLEGYGEAGTSIDGRLYLHVCPTISSKGLIAVSMKRKSIIDLGVRCTDGYDFLRIALTLAVGGLN
jgi:hypothetical protein